MAHLQKLIAVHGRTLLDGEACPVDVECMEELQSWMEGAWFCVVSRALDVHGIHAE